MPMLADIPVSTELVQRLVAMLRVVDADRTAAVLAQALGDELRVVALTIDDREEVLSVLDDPPDGLAELRGVLLREHEWRMREGL